MSNKQLDQIIRTELETQFMIMVRWNLEKTSPAYQEELAQIIINNWSGLSSHTQQLITHFCKKHLYGPQVHPICPHYKKTLESILRHVAPSAFDLIQSKISGDIAPNTSEIVEQEDEMPTTTELQEHAMSTHTVDTKQPEITMSEQTLLPFKAEYKKSYKIRLFQNKEWRALKTKIKQEYVNTSWTQFVNGTTPEAARQLIETNMKSALDLFQNNQKLKTKAEKYIERKSQKSLYALNETGQGVFRTKGTTLSSRVFRADTQRFYTLLNHVSSETKAKIKSEQGIAYNGTSFLGSGASGTVQLANLYENREHHIVAAKTVTAEFTSFLKRENLMRKKLKETPDTATWTQTNDYIEKMSVGRSKSSPILFMDLHTNGDIWGVTKKLNNIRDHALREKAARTLAKQMVESIKELHKAGIAHRDIKPDNLMMSKQGTIIPIDFGIATNKEKIAGAASGTLEYLAPEELQEQSNRNPKIADCFSLGQVLFNVWNAGNIKDTSLHAISNSLINPNPNERPTLETVLPTLENNTFTPSELLQVLRTGKQPS